MEDRTDSGVTVTKCNLIRQRHRNYTRTTTDDQNIEQVVLLNIYLLKI
jgi:hypothetical protein